MNIKEFEGSVAEYAQTLAIAEGILRPGEEIVLTLKIRKVIQAKIERKMKGMGKLGPETYPDDLDEKCALTIEQLDLPTRLERSVSSFMTLGMLARSQPEDIMNWGWGAGKKMASLTHELVSNAGLIPGKKIPMGPKEREVILKSETRELSYPVNNIGGFYPTIESLISTTEEQVRSRIKEAMNHSSHLSSGGWTLEKFFNHLVSRLALFDLKLKGSE